MKNIISLSAVILLAASTFLHTQTIGFSAGYGIISMDKVNKDLDNSKDALSSAGLFTSAPEKISGGLFIAGNVKYGFGNINIGVDGGYISSSGSFTYNDASGSFNENYDVSTIEILGLIEILIPTSNPIVQPFVQAAGGIGIASAEHTGDFIYYSDPSYNISVKNTVNGNYFSGRIKGGLQFSIQNVVLELAVGYRISNAGELKGDHVQNGIRYENMPVRDINGNALEFDYSGFLFTGGIGIRI